jgi:hypothetical protein
MLFLTFALPSIVLAIALPSDKGMGGITGIINAIPGAREAMDSCSVDGTPYKLAQCWISHDGREDWVGNVDNVPYRCDPFFRLHVRDWRDGSYCKAAYPDACRGGCFMKDG